MNEPTREEPMGVDLPLYRSHKLVRAAKIAGFEIEPAAETQYVALQFDRDTPPSGVIVDADWLLTRVKPGIEGPVEALAEKAVGGYYVLYEDAYSSWSPTEAFENGYSPVVGNPYDIADPCFHRIPNGHQPGVAHADGWLGRVPDRGIYGIGTHPESTEAEHFIVMQDGTVTEVGINGFTLENLLAVVIDRLKLFNDGAFHCQENKMAIHYAEQALGELNARTRRRIARGVEGTREV